jgi:hypothetical protein
MKHVARILAAIAVSNAAMFMVSCDFDYPYNPQQFVPPTLSLPLSGRDAIKNFLGISSYRFKLAFTRASEQSLYIVDFSQMEMNAAAGDEHPKVTKLANDPDRSGYQFDSPLFSPDGALVTYFLRSGAAAQVPYVQKADGQSAAVALAENGTDPHFWQDSSGALFIIYSDKFMTQINELSAISGFATYRQKIDPVTGAIMGSRTVLVDKPFNGGLSRNGRYLCTGYADGAIYDLDEGKLYRVNSGMQICNPAITPDTALQDAMLFLPFSGTQQLSYASGLSALGAIAMHEYLITVDKTNTVQWYIKHPADHVEWQDPDWTNLQDFAVALAKISSDDSDMRHDCYLIRRSDNALLKLTGGDFKLDNTATPAFWISPQVQ